MSCWCGHGPWHHYGYAYPPPMYPAAAYPPMDGRGSSGQGSAEELETRLPTSSRSSPACARNWQRSDAADRRASRRTPSASVELVGAPPGGVGPGPTASAAHRKEHDVRSL
jgi:hypothetical protein